jgi:hypothetical protein
MFGLGNKKKKQGEVTTSTGENTRKFEESVEIINSTVRKDIRLFFSDNQNLETLVSKIRNGDVMPAMGMMALEPTKENIEIMKQASEKIKKIYK